MLGAHGAVRIILLIVFAIVAHAVVRGVRVLAERLAAPSTGEGDWRQRLQRSNPKFTTVALLVTSALTFTIYFTALGLILSDASGGRIHLGTYLASASILGLAVAFGSQGLVQDVVLGLTLVFSDACDVGDVVEIGGQVGRVERIGLRFTTLVNFQGETIFIPNRNIGVVGRFRNGVVRLLLDVQIPEGADADAVGEQVMAIARSVRAQLPALVPKAPQSLGIERAGDDGWRFLRMKLRAWPGQGAAIEATLRQRIVAALRESDAAYSDWMVTASYRAD
jgi:small conductance mechanosensitive channel